MSRKTAAIALFASRIAYGVTMRADHFTGLERIRVPVTLAWPQYDRLVARPVHLPPTVRNVPLPDCGHVPMWDDPARVAGALLTGSTPRNGVVPGERTMI